MAQGKAGYVKYPPPGGAAGEVLQKNSIEDWDMRWGAGGGAASIALSAGTLSLLLTAFTLADLNGVSFGLNTDGVVTASAVGGAGNTGSLSAGTTRATLGEVVFSNSNGVSFGVSGQTLTAAHNGLTSQSNQAFSAAGGSSAFQTLAFNNANGISFSNNAGSVEASHNALTSQSNQNVTAANGGFAFQTLSFSNANGISFGTSAGSAITGSHNGLTTARASTDAVGLNTAHTNVTWTVNSSGLSLNAGGYAGTSTGFAGANISGSVTHNTLGLNLSLSVAAPGGGAAPVMSFWQNQDLGSAVGNTGATVAFPLGQTMFLFPLAGAEMVLPAQITCSTMMFEYSISGSTATLSAAHSSSIRVGIYTVSDNGSSLALVNSVESSWALAAATGNSTFYQGRRFLTIHSSQWSAQPVFSAGVNYFAAMWGLSSSRVAQTVGIVGQHLMATYARSGTVGVNPPAAATWQGLIPYIGIYGTTTAAFPPAIHFSQLNKQAANAFFVPLVIMNNFVSSF